MDPKMTAELKNQLWFTCSLSRERSLCLFYLSPMPYSSGLFFWFSCFAGFSVFFVLEFGFVILCAILSHPGPWFLLDLWHCRLWLCLGVVFGYNVIFRRWRLRSLTWVKYYSGCTNAYGLSYRYSYQPSPAVD